MQGRVLFLLLLLVGCAPNSPSTSPPQALTITPSSDAAILAEVIPFPQDRISSKASVAEVNGIETYDRSLNAVPDGNALNLISGSNTLSWGIWAFSPGMASIDTLELVMSLPQTNVAYIGIADYSTGRWWFHLPVSEGLSLKLTDAKHKSPLGNCYVAVITAKANEATVHKLLLNSESQWSITTIDDGGSAAAGLYTSIVMVSGRPAICYGTSSHELYYIRAEDGTGLAWGERVQIANGPRCEHISLAVTPDGHPAVCWFYDTSPGVLEYTSATGVGDYWHAKQMVDGTYPDGEDVGRFASLTNDGFNQVAVSYFDANLNALKYVKGYTDPASWGPPSIAAVGACSYTTLLYESYNRPLISYYDEGSGDLKLVGRNSEGTAWNPPQTVDNAGDVGRYASGAIVNSQPAISYYDSTNGNLKFARYDLIGGEWVIMALDSADDVGQFTSLAVIGGNPAISYYDATNGALKYIAALDSKGTSWGDPVTVDSICDVGQYSALTEANGKPAISYHDATNGSLKYAVFVGP